MDSDLTREKLNEDFNLQLSSSLTPVYYSCGFCGYELNLNSSNRSTSSFIGSAYGKLIKRGMISFFSIDESRFEQIEQLRWIPYLHFKRSWGFFQRTTKLACGKCGNHIGMLTPSNNAPAVVTKGVQ